MLPGQNKRRTRLSVASFAGDRRSRFGLAGSLALHAAVIAATMFTWAHRLDIADESPPIVPVDLVTIGEKTNIAPVVREQPKLEVKVEPQTPQPDMPPVPKIETPPPQQAEAAPPEQAPSEPLVKQKPQPASPKLRPKPPAPEKAKEKFDVNSILALLDKKHPQPEAQARGKTGPRAIKGVGAQNAMTMDLADALRNQIAQCWSPPVGSPNPQDLIVSFELFLNPDGSVAQPPQLAAQSQSAAAGNPYLRAAAEAGRRAIYTCAPYKLPADRYGQWRDITLVFDPRQMIGNE